MQKRRYGLWFLNMYCVCLSLALSFHMLCLCLIITHVIMTLMHQCNESYRLIVVHMVLSLPSHGKISFKKMKINFNKSKFIKTNESSYSKFEFIKKYG